MTQGSNLCLLHWQADSLTIEPPGKSLVLPIGALLGPWRRAYKCMPVPSISGAGPHLTSLKVSWLTSQTQKSPPTYCRYQGSHPGRKVVNLVSHSLLDSSRALPGPWRHIASETGVEEACKPEQRPVVGAWAGDSSLHQSLVWILLILSSWSGPWRRCS